MADAMNDLDAYLDNLDENGQHKGKIAAIPYRNGKDGRDWVIFKVENIDEESPFHGEEYENWIQDRSALSVDDFNSLPGSEKSRVRNDKRRLLEFLMKCGFSEDEAKEIRTNPKSDLRKMAVGRLVWFTISVSENNNRTFRNIVDLQIVVEDDGTNNDMPPF